MNDERTGVIAHYEPAAGRTYYHGVKLNDAGQLHTAIRLLQRPELSERLAGWLSEAIDCEPPPRSISLASNLRGKAWRWHIRPASTGKVE